MNCNCDGYEAEIVELKEKLEMAEDRIKHLEKVIDDQVAEIRSSVDVLISEL